MSTLRPGIAERILKHNAEEEPLVVGKNINGLVRFPEIEAGSILEPQTGTPLRLAIRQGHVTVARLLIEAGANVNQWSKGYHFSSYYEWRYPICDAIHFEQPACVRLLIASGADVEELPVDYQFVNRDEPGLEEQYFKILRRPLRERQVEFEKLAKAGKLRSTPLGFVNVACPLLLAINRGNPEIVEILLEGGADPNVFIDRDEPDSRRLEAKTIGDHRPLHIAVTKGNVEVVRLLIKKGANVNAVTSDGQTVLDRAARSRNHDIVHLLQESGAK